MCTLHFCKDLRVVHLYLSENLCYPRIIWLLYGKTEDDSIM